MKLFEVLAVGDANIDLTLKVDHLPTQDDKVLGQKVSEQVGGTVANSACVCGSLGLKVATLAKVATNNDGTLVLNEYAKYNVNVDYVTQHADYEQSKAIIMLDASGEKSLIFIPSSPYGYSNQQIRTPILNSQYIYTMPGNIEKFIALGQIAKDAGTKVVVDIEPTILTKSTDLNDILEYSDLVFFNQEGFKKATGEYPTKQTLAQLTDTYSLDGVVVTLGAQGVSAYVQDEFVEFEGFKVPVVDTTGAGDTFNASFLYTQIKNMKPYESLKFACAAAAISIGEIGPKGNVPTLEKIQAFLNSNIFER